MKGQSLDRSCFCCSWLTSSRVTTSVHTFMLTILRYMVHVIRRLQPFFERRYLHLWTMSHRGCTAINSSSTPQRFRCCDVRQAVGNIRSHRKPHASAMILSSLPAGYATWASTWTLEASVKIHVSRIDFISSGLVGDASHDQSYSRS